MIKEELEKLKQTVDYFGHWYDVIGEERIVILEKSIDYIDTLEQDKCELLGIIQGKDKVIQDLKEDNADLKQSLDWANEREKELKAQIEKMKCCENCKHHYWLYEELTCRIHKIDVDTCNSWEMKND